MTDAEAAGDGWIFTCCGLVGGVEKISSLRCYDDLPLYTDLSCRDGPEGSKP